MLMHLRILGLALLLALVSAANAEAVYTIVGTPNCEAGGINSVTTTAVNSTGADGLILSVAWYPGGTTPTLTDTGSNSFTGLTARNNGNLTTRLFYDVGGLTTNASHTITATGSGAAPSVCYVFVSGSGEFGLESGSSGSASSGAPGSLTPACNDNLVISGLGTEGNSGAMTPDSSPTGSDYIGFSSGNNEGGGIGWWIQTTAAALNPTWSWGTSVSYGVTLATFPPSGGCAAGGAAPPDSGLRLRGMGNGR